MPFSFLFFTPAVSTGEAETGLKGQYRQTSRRVGLNSHLAALRATRCYSGSSLSEARACSPCDWLPEEMLTRLPHTSIRRPTRLLAEAGREARLLLVPLRSFGIQLQCLPYAHRQRAWFPSFDYYSHPFFLPQCPHEGGRDHNAPTQRTRARHCPHWRRPPSSLDALIGVIFTAARRLQYRWPSRWNRDAGVVDDGRCLSLAKRLICTGEDESSASSPQKWLTGMQAPTNPFQRVLGTFHGNSMSDRLQSRNSLTTLLVHLRNLC